MTMETILLIVIALLAGASFLLLLTRNGKAQQEQWQEMLRRQMQENREEMNRSLAALRMEMTKTLSENMRQMTETLNANMRMMDDAMHKNMMTNAELQRQRFDNMAQRQEELMRSTEKRLDDMRDMVEERLQKTLNERISQSFEMVRAHLENVQKGLGEMKNLAQDVGGLKRVLSNVKTRGTFGEIQLGALLEQMLSPEQYAANVKTKRGATEFVEYAIKLPGKDDRDSIVFLPIDAKFPKDTYEHYYDAYESGDTALIESAGKQLETAIKRMAKDIHEKYVDPPHTTDFAIMFLPFENIYAEVIRRTALVETLQRDYKVVVTGPTTLGAILNSLQMGFRTLAIQKRTSEVWSILAAVKTEFGKFGTLLEKVQKNLQQAGNQIEDLMGVRTRAIENKLRKVEELPQEDGDKLRLDL
jgi:DNA recombination protein RmuC